MEAGRRLLDDEGPDAVTHLRISELTGVARTTIYRHWPDREALLADVVASTTSTDGGGGRTDGAASTRKPADTGSVRGDLEAELGRIGSRFGRRGDARLLHLVGRGEHSRAFAELRRDRFRSRAVDPVCEILARGVERGELPGDLDTEAAAIDLVAPLFFRRFFLGERVDDDLVAGGIDRFLVAHPPWSE